MQTLQDFISWAGSQRKAAELLGIDETKLSRIKTGKVRRWGDIAIAIEQATGGRYRAADLLGLTSKN